MARTSRALIRWLGCLAALALVLTGFVAVSPAHADEAGSEGSSLWDESPEPEVIGTVVDQSGHPVSGVNVDIQDDESCWIYECATYSSTTDEAGQFTANAGRIVPSESYSITLDYESTRYISDYAKGHPEWDRRVQNQGLTTYESLTGLGPDALRPVFVLVKPDPFYFYGYIRDEKGNYVTASVGAYVAGRSSTPRATEVTDWEASADDPSNDWGWAGTYSFRRLTPGAKYKLRIEEPEDGQHSAAAWVGGSSYATATTFVATKKRMDLVYKPAAVKLAASKAPVVLGTARVGSKLTVRAATWKVKPSKLSYRWLRDGKTIAGATKSSYVPVAKDKGHKLSIKITGTRSGYVSASSTSARTKAVAAGKLSVSKRPKVTGTYLPGRTLKVSKGSWKTKPTSYAYRWYRSGKAVKGATKSSYKLTKKDAGRKVYARVTVKRSGYATASSSAVSKRVAKGALKLGKVTITGSRTAGKTLTAHVKKPYGAKLKYQWYRNGKAIKGATRRTHKLGYADWLEHVSVRVTVSRSGYVGSARSSSRTYIAHGGKYEYTGGSSSSSGSSSSGSGYSGYTGPRCYAPGGRTWTPC